jgi:CheY-like chemotaxis protein
MTLIKEQLSVEMGIPDCNITATFSGDLAI